MFPTVYGKFQGMLATVFGQGTWEIECVLVYLPHMTTGVNAGNTWRGKYNRKGNHGRGKFIMKGGWGVGVRGGRGGGE